jgi:hypothetical protein
MHEKRHDGQQVDQAAWKESGEELCGYVESWKKPVFFSGHTAYSAEYLFLLWLSLISYQWSMFNNAVGLCATSV